MYSIDSRFRNDPHYVMFATLLKEAVTMKSCAQTSFRKASRLPKYTQNFVKEADKAELLRSNQGFKHFKNMRGFAPYYQSHGLDLMAFIRQHGTPQGYLTLSQAQLRWDELLLSIVRTMRKDKCHWDENQDIKDLFWNNDDKNIDLEFIKNLDEKYRRFFGYQQHTTSYPALSKKSSKSL